jgi:hypothetical protein
MGSYKRMHPDNADRWRLLQRKRTSVPDVELRATFPTRSSLPSVSSFSHSQPTSWASTPPAAPPSTSYATHQRLPVPCPTQPRPWNATMDDSSPSFNYEGSPQYHSPTLLPDHHSHSTLPPLSGTDESFTSFIPLTPRPQTPPPFQFTSSSLSTALTDPHVPKPLPPIHLNSPQLQYPASQDPGSQPSASDSPNPGNTSPARQFGCIPIYDDTDDIHMSDNMYSDQERHSHVSDVGTRSGEHTLVCNELESRVLQESSNIHREPTEASHAVCITAPISSPPRCPSPHVFLPSTSTTPIVSPLSLSPNSSSPIDLPSTNAVSPSSVLFSSHYPLEPKKKRISVRRRVESNGPLRLDSALPATAE